MKTVCKSLLVLSIPSFALGADRTIASGGTFAGVVNVIVGWINSIVVVVAGLALLVFIWGLSKFIAKAGDTSEHQKGKDLMVWGTIGLFVMGSLWGLISLISGSFF